MSKPKHYSRGNESIVEGEARKVLKFAVDTGRRVEIYADEAEWLLAHLPASDPKAEETK